MTNKCPNPNSSIFEYWVIVISFVIGTWTLAICPAANAQPSGFHEGPYFMLHGGLLNFSADNNVRTSTKVGRDFEPSVGFNFGWNLKDWIGPELEVRYATNKNGGNREHIVNVNINAVYSFIIDQLGISKNSAVIPFIQTGPAIQLAAVPGDVLSTDNTMAVWGAGFGVGAGVKILFKRYGYAGILGQSDFIHLPNKYQNIGGSMVKVMNGGWEPEVGVSLMAGVHF